MKKLEKSIAGPKIPPIFASETTKTALPVETKHKKIITIKRYDNENNGIDPDDSCPVR